MNIIAFCPNSSSTVRCDESINAINIINEFITYLESVELGDRIQIGRFDKYSNLFSFRINLIGARKDSLYLIKQFFHLHKFSFDLWNSEVGTTKEEPSEYL
ncbi:hypothetical protein [Bacillus sp. NPDC094106]|uniref:hypothetical protein n=1 Tax=Bacillus sp. NPDC094106 TaxID=3363949 RepID=UPI00381E2EA7